MSTLPLVLIRIFSAPSMVVSNRGELTACFTASKIEQSSVSDARFLQPYKNKIINIYQINGQVINNMASENGTMAGKYSKYNKEKLPAIIKECYEVIKGINQENFLYLFDYLDKVYEEYILNK